jgi:hypothetical protein
MGAAPLGLNEDHPAWTDEHMVVVAAAEDEVVDKSPAVLPQWTEFLSRPLLGHLACHQRSGAAGKDDEGQSPSRP